MGQSEEIRPPGKFFYRLGRFHGSRHGRFLGSTQKLKEELCLKLRGRDEVISAHQEIRPPGKLNGSAELRPSLDLLGI